MADKIIITSDGTVKGTIVKIDGKDMTKDYKVTNIYFNAHGGYTYKSQYSGDTYTNPPSVSYDISYLDGDKKKSAKRKKKEIMDGVRDAVHTIIHSSIDVSEYT